MILFKSYVKIDVQTNKQPCRYYIFIVGGFLKSLNYKLLCYKFNPDENNLFGNFLQRFLFFAATIRLKDVGDTML